MPYWSIVIPSKAGTEGAILEKGSCEQFVEHQGSSRGRPVVCFETGEVFPSARSASKSLGLSKSMVGQAVVKKVSAGGFHWYFADQPDPDPTEFKKPRAKAVVCHETGEVFASMTEAAKAKGTTKGVMQHAVRSGCKAGGYHWYLADQPGPALPHFSENIKKPVVNIETGEVFETQSTAAKSINRNRSAISNAVKSGCTAGGYHWRRATEEEIARLENGK